MLPLPFTLRLKTAAQTQNEIDASMKLSTMEASPRRMHFQYQPLVRAIHTLLWRHKASQQFFVALWTTLSLCIVQGATTPNDAPTTPSRSHWSFQPLRHPTIPSSVKQESAELNPIDLFIHARLRSSGLQPAPETDRATLIRRLTLDLHGLPPTPAEMDAFLKDRSPRSYTSLVERLLASPRYGERWARHWLDVARYTESQGFEYDKLRDHAWHYRDYLINSFNHDKPYDRFMREQIAGDAIDPITQESIIATSLLVCGPWDEAGNSQANATQKALTREEEMDDLVSVVSQTFLGITVNCARCHAHKFDPIPQEEYYRFRSVFDGIKHGERPIATPQEFKARETRLENLRRQIANARTEQQKLESIAWKRWNEMRVGNSPAHRASSSTAPRAVWTFDPALASRGTLKAGASLSNTTLLLNTPGSHFQSDPIHLEIREKTLEAWVALDTLDQQGGGVITIEKDDGRTFDSIVFAERQPRKWTAGSNGFERTRDLDATEESTAPGGLIHVAAIYQADNTIALFRNGEPYGKAYKPGFPLQTFPAGKSHILLGMRHTGGGKPFLTGAIHHAALYDRALSTEEIKLIFQSSNHHVPLKEVLNGLTPNETDLHSKSVQTERRLKQELDAIKPLPVSYVGTRVQPASARMLKRGDVKSPGEIVSPGTLSAITSLSPEFGLPPDAPEKDRRLRFADWLANPQNPLPARVMANRVWLWHFGQGLVATPNDFGAAGAKPSHPELLDWLALHFMQNGWSLKALHRTIVHSATYRQSSRFDPKAGEVDADNALLWRYAPKRLEAEVIRDSMLYASGELNWSMGGPSFRPFEILKFPANAYVPIDKTGPAYNRRTVYRMNVNSGKEPMLDALDCPDPSVKTPRRGTTTTPLQALGLMNSSFVLRQAQQLAERALRESSGSRIDAIRQAYLLALGRPPSPAESSAALQETEHDQNLSSLAWALFNSTEFVYAR